jgi:hypothetical protein
MGERMKRRRKKLVLQLGEASLIRKISEKKFGGRQKDSPPA